LARHFWITRSSAGGVIGCTDEIGGGVPAMIALIRLAWLLPSNALWPVTAS